MAQTDIKHLGVREFREKLSDHLMSKDPIAVTKHGLTVGYYIPTHQPVTEGDKQALLEASKRLQTLLEEQDLNPEILIKETQQLRKQTKQATNV